MATTLAPVDSREVVRCDHCQLVQFRTSNNFCRKCRAPLDDEPEPVVPEAVAAPPASSIDEHRSHLQIAQTIRSLRQRSGLSQRQLAARMQVPRTYVSKIENEKATPTLSSLERLANALKVSVCDLLSGSGRSRDLEVRELMADPFLGLLLPEVLKLDGLQRSSFLSELRDMTTRTRRTA